MDRVENEEPPTIKKVMRDGWIFDTHTALIDPDGYCGHRGDIFVPLPSDIAKLGIKGTRLSRTAFGRRNNVWRPIPMDGSGCPVANVYPGSL